MVSNGPNLKVKTIQQTVIAAAAVAAAQLEKTPPPLPILVVEGETNSTIIVASYKGELGIYTITKNDSHPLHLVPAAKYRALLFEECENVQVVVLSKLLKCSFVRSAGCSILFRETLIGSLEFYRCKQSDVTLEKPLNLVQVNSCDRIRFFHAPGDFPPVLYVINLSVDISCSQGATATILANTFDNLLNQRVVSVQTNPRGPPLVEGGTLPIYLQEISQMLF